MPGAATRTLTEMLTEAQAILSTVSADVRLTVEEKTTTLAAISSIDVNKGRLSNNRVPNPQRQAFHDALLSLVAQLIGAETRLGLRAVDFYDALDLLMDAAEAGLLGIQSVTSELGDPNEPPRVAR